MNETAVRMLNKIQNEQFQKYIAEFDVVSVQNAAYHCMVFEDEGG